MLIVLDVVQAYQTLNFILKHAPLLLTLSMIFIFSLVVSYKCIMCIEI